jgi:transposase InsO family protein
MGKPNFSDDFKRDAVHQITVRGYAVREVSQRLGVSTYSLYKWMKFYAKAASQTSSVDHEAESRRLKRELARVAGIRAEIGYKRKPGKYGGRPSVVVDNTLDRQFDVTAPDTAWVSDITYIKTYEGFLYLAVIIDLYSRRVIGWATQSRQPTDLVLQALLMAVWRRKPKRRVLIHTDQGSQYTSKDWAAFLRAHNIEHSMSRRGNCHDNARVHCPRTNGGQRLA